MAAGTLPKMENWDLTLNEGDGTVTYVTRWLVYSDGDTLGWNESSSIASPDAEVDFVTIAKAHYDNAKAGLGADPYNVTFPAEDEGERFQFSPDA